MMMRRRSGGDCRRLRLMVTDVVVVFAAVVVVIASSSSFSANANAEGGNENENDNKQLVRGGPEGVVWVVQLSDLHISVHHPERALDFSNLVAPTLSLLHPSLVLITGDLTDGKSKDLLVMKQNEVEWQHYHRVIDDVVRSSGLHKSIFYDLRGNHDNFGIPAAGGSFDFYSNYSINAHFHRTRPVNSFTLQTGEFRYLFVGLDTTSSVGLRGPTNLFGHPTDQLLDEVDSHLSQWDSDSTKHVTKIAFGHFPLSFSASASSGKTLKNVFLKHSISAYLCGHLHTGFGKNLKRYHHSADHFISHNFFQPNMNQMPAGIPTNCSSAVKEFWEWEMGDWRKSRAMRILAIDRGYVSFLDIDLKSGTKKTIILPTFPLDSRFMSTSSSRQRYECQYVASLSIETIRALVFSVSPIVSVVARIYDSRPGNLLVVVETFMSKSDGYSSRGDLYTALWNYKAFEDPAPDRFWLQITATDIRGRSSSSELRPFSINGLSAKVSWTWSEFLVMGCQWAALYYPLFWSAMYFIFLILIIPKSLLVFSRKEYTYRNFVARKGFINGLGWVLQEICRTPVLWFGVLAYSFYLIFFPWLSGQVFTEGGERGYMTIMGWAVNTSGESRQHEYLGLPDVMVVVLPHLIFVVLPTILVSGALAAERCLYQEHFLSLSRKKKDDYDTGSNSHDYQDGAKAKFHSGARWIRKVLLLVCLVIYWKHFKTRDLKLIPKSARNTLKTRRTCCKKIHERITAVSG